VDRRVSLALRQWLRSRAAVVRDVCAVGWRSVLKSRLMKSLVVAAFVAGAVVSVSPARAGYTAVKQPKRGAGPSHERILESVYGGNFVADAAGLSFSNESGVTVTRVEDGAGGDELWTGKTIAARAVAAAAGKQRAAKYFGATVAGQPRDLVTTSGRQLTPADGSQQSAVVDNELVFRQGNGRRAKAFSSIGAANKDGMDHLVTYEVKGLTGQQSSVYLLCWEDRFARRSDRDYNDLVIEAKAAEVASRAPLTEPLLIPLPPAAWPGLAGLGAVAWSLRRRGAVRRWKLAV
jgi:hypothetical protein